MPSSLERIEPYGLFHFGLPAAFLLYLGKFVCKVPNGLI